MVTELVAHHPALAIVFTTALVLACGTIGQVLGRKLNVPPMLFLLAFGILLGPEVAGIIQPAVYGDGLRAIVSVAVAIIVFEGGLLIDVRHLHHVSRSVGALVTVGALTTFALGGVVAHYLMGMPLKIAMLFGAIVSVTGPTVVTPILKRLPLNRRVKTTLEAEAVLVDAVGVLLVAGVFLYITGSNASPAGGILNLLVSLSIGCGVGAATALGIKLALSRATLMPPDLVRLTVLGAVLLGFSAAELLAHESGIAAVAVAGLWAGSMKLPYEETIRQFKGDLTLIALCVVFILLAANIPLASLVALGWPGLATVFLLMVAVRPIAVALATWGSGLSFRERAFIAWMGPRGIVAASMASLMSIELTAWDVQGAESIAPLVFLTILVTVSVQGGLAGWMAGRLKVMPKKIIVAGGDDIALRLAGQLAADGEVVVLIDRDVAAARAEGFSAVEGDPTALEALERAGIAWCHTLVAATPSDKSNLVMCQLARARFPELRLVARVNEASRAGDFRESDIETLTMADAAAMSLSMLVMRPTALGLFGLAGNPETIVEVKLTNARWSGRPLKHMNLPKDCLVAMVRRSGKVTVPDGDMALELGDRLTLLGQRVAVETLRDELEAET